MFKEKLEIIHASQILTNDHQILVLSYLSNYLLLYLFISGFQIKNLFGENDCTYLLFHFKVKKQVLRKEELQKIKRFCS